MKTFKLNNQNLKCGKGFVFLCCIIQFLLFAMLITGCKKNEEATAAQETSTITDIDGNIYKTVKIGNQWWMAENLNVKKYRNGHFIKLSQDSAAWADTVGSYCLYPSVPSVHPPGLLYNWSAVTSPDNIAPEGWHVPSDDEWKELEKSIGMDATDADKSGWRGTDEGEKLKISSSSSEQGWTSYAGIWSTNESGFTALGGSCRLYNGTFGYLGLQATGFWWTTSSHSDDEAWYRYLDYKSAGVFRSHCDKNYGCSIRCVKD